MKKDVKCWCVLSELLTFCCEQFQKFAQVSKDSYFESLLRVVSKDSYFHGTSWVSIIEENRWWMVLVELAMIIIVDWTNHDYYG